MKNEYYKKSKAFTLAEVLITLVVVGALAVLTIPTLVNKASNKVYATQVKNMAAMIEQLAQDELMANKTYDLGNTDFSNPDTLLTDKHFSISKTCSDSDKCWDNGYKTLEKQTTEMSIQSTINNGSSRTIILNNGVLLSYVRYYEGVKSGLDGTVSARYYQYFLIDVNGKDKPNIVGRDVFSFKMVDSGHIENDSSADMDNLITSCKGGNSYDCFYALKDNNWKMPY